MTQQLPAEGAQNPSNYGNADSMLNVQGEHALSRTRLSRPSSLEIQPSLSPPNQNDLLKQVGACFNDIPLSTAPIDEVEHSRAVQQKNNVDQLQSMGQPVAEIAVWHLLHFLPATDPWTPLLRHPKLGHISLKGGQGDEVVNNVAHAARAAGDQKSSTAVEAENGTSAGGQEQANKVHGHVDGVDGGMSDDQPWCVSADEMHAMHSCSE